jgi:CRISPR-associated protein Cmr1
MQTITFTCETITPMFLSGADGTSPELRAPSIKGALRFWWRAMNGHLGLEDTKDENGNIIKGLKSTEEEILGGTEESSKVRIRVRHGKTKSITGSKAIENGDKGIDYLLYIFKHQRKNDEGFDIGTPFEIILSCKDNDTQYLIEACSAFWVFIYLGGIGSRARRGAGNIKIVDTKITDSEISKKLPSFSPSKYNSIINFYEENYKNIVSIFNKNQKNKTAIPTYSTLINHNIYIGEKKHTSWQKALNEIGTDMYDTRVYFEEEDRKFTIDDLDLKAAFGLPIQIQKAPKFEGYYVDLELHNRRASPLVISLVEHKPSCFYWTLIRFDGLFSEDRIVLRNSKKQIHSDADGEPYTWRGNGIDGSLIDTFIEKISAKKIQL